MAFKTQSTIDADHHKGILALNSITPGPLILTGLSLTNAQPLHVAIVDSAGSQVTAFGGGQSANFGSSVATATSTTSTSSGLAGPGAALRWFITDVVLTNSGATTVTVNLQNGSAGATILTGIAPNGGGHSIHLKTPLGTMSVNTIPYFQASGSTTTLSVSVSAYLGA